MDTQYLETLEIKIGQVLDRLQDLQQERGELQEQVATWQAKYEEAARQMEKLSEECSALRRNQRDVGNEELIRSKIAALLAKLEAA